ncbi:hypothetical protein [Halobacillus sp. K22]|uniref:hypothetical protein n=1 Tax=Halobacillus sp. K22 TaxID=3457431 RepID=UPI003FCDB2B3
MAYLYYAKVNVNSNIHEVSQTKEGIPKIMKRVFDELNDETEFTINDTKNFLDDSGDEREIVKSETYNFSLLNKVNEVNDFYITGELVRRFPMRAERFDDESRISKSVVYENNSVSTNFLFDMRSEIVVFFERSKLGYNQFMEGFNGLLNEHITDIGFEIFLEKDKLSIRERIKMIKKVRKISSTIIPPNANEEPLQELFDKQSDKMARANVTKSTNVFESNKRSERGIDVDSEEISNTIDLSEAFSERGYGKLQVEGENSKGLEVSYDSDKDSPFQTTISEKQKNNLEDFVDKAKKGISNLLGKQTVDRVKRESENQSKDQPHNKQ